MRFILFREASHLATDGPIFPMPWYLSGLTDQTTEDPRNSESIFKNTLLNRSEVVDFQVIVCLSYWSTSTEIVFKTLSSSLVKPRSKTRRLLITISPIFFFTVAFSGKNKQVHPCCHSPMAKQFKYKVQMRMLCMLPVSAERSKSSSYGIPQYFVAYVLYTAYLANGILPTRSCRLGVKLSAMSPWQRLSLIFSFHVSFSWGTSKSLSIRGWWTLPCWDSPETKWRQVQNHTQAWIWPPLFYMACFTGSRSRTLCREDLHCSCFRACKVCGASYHKGSGQNQSFGFPGATNISRQFLGRE